MTEPDVALLDAGEIGPFGAGFRSPPGVREPPGIRSCRFRDEPDL